MGRMRELTEHTNIEVAIASITSSFDRTWKWVIALAMSVISYILPDETTFRVAVIAGLSIILDFITGVAVAYVTQTPITSRGMSRTIGKIIGYSAALAVVATVSKEVPFLKDVQTSAVTGVATLVLLTEAVSIVENAHKLGIKIPSWILKFMRKGIDLINDGPEKEKEKIDKQGE